MDLFPFTAALFGRENFLLLLEASACTTSSSVFLARNCSTGTKLQAASRFGEDFFVLGVFKTTKSGRRLFGTQNTSNSFGWSLKTRHTRHTRPLQNISSLFDNNESSKSLCFFSTKTACPGLERVHFSEVATSGNLWSAVLQAWINGDTRQMWQHNFWARLTHWSAGFAIRCVHYLVRYIQEKQCKILESICFPNSHINLSIDL